MSKPLHTGKGCPGGGETGYLHSLLGALDGARRRIGGSSEMNGSEVGRLTWSLSIQIWKAGHIPEGWSLWCSQVRGSLLGFLQLRDWWLLTWKWPSKWFAEHFHLTHRANSHILYRQRPGMLQFHAKATALLYISLSSSFVKGTHYSGDA